MTTQILVTLGPSSLNQEFIELCDRSGVFVFRINLSHTPIEKLRETINTIRRYTSTPICLDSEGAQIRNQYMRNNEVSFEKDEVVRIHYQTVEGDSRNISFTPKFIAKEFKVGDVINIDFHSAGLKVVKVDESGCDAIVIESGKVGNNKAADLNRDIPMPALTEKDEAAIEIGKAMGIGHFALSFAGSKGNVDLFRSKVGKESYIISKIESRPGVLNLYKIMESTDAILIDRGDLSRQLPIEKIPFMQRRIIASARSKNKSVFVATNLLESMVISKHPTRAEVNDVVSTLLMGASGLVLASETAVGSYPNECVKMIKALIEQFERWTPNTSIAELLE